MLHKQDLFKKPHVDKHDEIFRFRIKNSNLRHIFRELMPMGVYVGSSDPLRILPFTETSASVAFLQTHVGCRRNTCTFCPFYKDLKFYEKSQEQIMSDINRISAYYHHQSDRNVSRVMLLDADAVDMEKSKLVRTIRYLRKKFPKYKRKAAKILYWDDTEDCFFTEKLNDITSPVEVSAFIHTETIVKMGLDLFYDLKREGLTMLWWGVESGCEDLLRAVNKINYSAGKNNKYQQDVLKAGQILNSAGIFYVTMIIIGLGGERYFDTHVNQTRALLEEIQPPGIVLSNLVVDWTSQYARQIEMGEFDVLSPQRMQVQREFIESIAQNSFQFDYDLNCITSFALAAS